MTYKTVKDFGTSSFIEKKSKFIGYGKPVKTEEEAQAFIKEIKQKHKDATHNVWAYSLREGNIQRYSDDGEPQGTAGIPVLEVLKKSEVVDAVLVATRYFGGTMLGGGGLVRAYSHTASIGMNASVPVMMKNCVLCSLRCPYGHYAKFEEYCGKHSAVIDETLFEDCVVIKFHALPDNLEKLKKDYSDLSKGQGVITEEDTDFYPFPID